ncbi:MAG: hypothetical protein GQ546_14625 [Gammaproteobacteria bacterium]|nr:hypothetical protein [Gammaproteobacteria bacterium]
MKIKSINKYFICLFMLSIFSSTASAADYPVAGTAPSQRPAGAPVMEWVQHNQAWYKYALTGVDMPYPKSLYFLDNQGNWYTPFTIPGMTGPYDLRGWHR